MRTRSTALALAMFAVVRFAGAQDRSESVRIVVTGEIRKIDQKNKTFQFKIPLDRPQRGGFNRPGANPGGQGGGRGGGRGGRGRFPGPPIPPVNENQKDSIEVKVFVSPNTVLRGDPDFNFSNLKSGKHVAVTGFHKGTGNDIEAIEVQQ